MALKIEDGDWIPLFRKIRENWLWRDAEDLRAWIDLLMLANHHEGTFKFRRHLHPIQRGQVATTYKSLAERNGWGRNRVKGFLLRLCHDRAIAVQPRTFDVKTDTWLDSKSDSGFLLVTITNYPLRKQAGGKRPANDTATIAATGQRLSSDWTANGHIQEREEGKEGEKGEEPKAVPPLPPFMTLTPATGLKAPRIAHKAREFVGTNFQKEQVRTRILEMVGLLENRDEVPEDRIFLHVRQYWNLRENLNLETTAEKADRAFLYALDECIKKGVTTPNYLATVVRNAIGKLRDGVKLG